MGKPGMIKRGMVTCYYCGAVLTDGNLELDHFPIPEKAGGKQVVPCCICCHDMKDRVEFDLWSKEWLAKVRGEFSGLSREMKIFLAQAMRRIYAWRQNGQNGN